MMAVVTGGSGSGKSAFAEEKILSFGEGKRIYIATMYPFDEESRKRVARHRQMRAGKKFETLECYTGLKNITLPKGCSVLLECMSNLAANEMFRPDGAQEKTVEEICAGIRHLREQAENLVVVTNEVFSDGIQYDGETETYLRYLGKINQYLAQTADLVVEVVYGIPICHKGGNAG